MAPRLLAAAAFAPAPGSMHELPLAADDEVFLLDQPAPEGWVAVQHARTKHCGLVPASFLLQELDGEGEDVEPTDADAQEASAESGGAAASAPAATPPQDRSERLRKLYAEREMQRIATRDFRPDPGSVFEVSMNEGDLLELADVRWPVPPGWLAVKKQGVGASGTELVGLVPESCVKMPPEPEEALPSAEEQKEAAERALRAAKQEKEKAQRELRAREAELDAERSRKEAAEKAERERLEQLKGAETKQAELSEQLSELEEMREREAVLKAEVEALKQGGDEAALLEIEVKRELRAMVQARKAAFEKEMAAKAKREEARKALEAVQTEKRQKLEEAFAEQAEAERAYLQSEEALRKAEFERNRAAAGLEEARRCVAEAKRRLEDDSDEGGTKAATERALQELIPTVRTLLDPEPEVVKEVTETVPQALLRLAEEAATAKLEKIRQSEEPQPELLARRGLEKGLFGGSLPPPRPGGGAVSSQEAASSHASRQGSMQGSRPESRAAGGDDSVGGGMVEQMRRLLAENAMRAIDLFREMDTDGNGSISIVEFRQCLAQLGLEAPSSADVKAAFDSYDGDASGTITLREMSRALRAPALPHPRSAAGNAAVQAMPGVPESSAAGAPEQISPPGIAPSVAPLTVAEAPITFPAAPSVAPSTLTDPTGAPHLPGMSPDAMASTLASLQRPLLDDAVDVSAGNSAAAVTASAPMAAAGAPSQARQRTPGSPHQPLRPLTQQQQPPPQLQQQHVVAAGGLGRRQSSKAVLQPQAPKAYFSGGFPGGQQRLVDDVYGRKQPPQPTQEQQQRLAHQDGPWRQASAWSYPGAPPPLCAQGSLSDAQPSSHPPPHPLNSRTSSLARSASYNALAGGPVQRGASGGVGEPRTISIAHANAQARRSISSHAKRLAAARQYRERELPDGWQKGRFYGPNSEEQRQGSTTMARQGSAPMLTVVKHRPPPPPPRTMDTPSTGAYGTTPPTADAGEAAEPVPAFGASSGRFT